MPPNPYQGTRARAAEVLQSTKEAATAVKNVQSVVCVHMFRASFYIAHTHTCTHSLRITFPIYFHAQPRAVPSQCGRARSNPSPCHTTFAEPSSLPPPPPSDEEDEEDDEQEEQKEQEEGGSSEEQGDGDAEGEQQHGNGVMANGDNTGPSTTLQLQEEDEELFDGGCPVSACFGL